MRVREIITESTDQRSKVQKLLDLIRHPNTEPTIKAVALEKLRNLGEIPPTGQRSQIPSIHTNITDYTMPFVGGMTYGNIYNILSSLNPRPTTIHFLRQGTVHMFVPPPYNNLTKKQYIELIQSKIACKNIMDKYIVNDNNQGGYVFTLYFL
jgi:hypothetical protein